MKNNWKPIIATLLNQLELRGFGFEYVDDGEDILRPTKRDELIDAIDSVDQSVLRVSHADWAGGTKTFHSIVIILGNDADEIVSDYTIPELSAATTQLLEAAIESYERIWRDRKVPQIADRKEGR